MIEDRIPPPPRPTHPEASKAAENEALMHFKQLHLDRLKHISDAAQAAASAATNAYLDMLVHDKPRPPRFTYKFWSVTVPFALIWGVLSALAYWWFFKR